MRYNEFSNHFKEFPLFSTNDIYKIDPAFHRRRLVEWQDDNHLIKIANGFYTFKEHKINEQFLFLASNKIYQPSYISLESALSYYHFIPEGVFSLTAITTNKTKEFETELVAFKYRKIKNELFMGYCLLPYNNVLIKMATAEKALLDFFYFNKNINTKVELEHLRFNIIEIKKSVSFKRLNVLCRYFNNSKLNEQVNLFTQFVNHA
ncbi:MAG: hypothetical protein ABI723_27300 [Bacteroidia bacterium]